MVRLNLIVALLLSTFCGYVSAYEHCLNLYPDRFVLRCMLLHQQTRAWIQQDTYYRYRQEDWSTPEGRTRAVERLLREHRAQQPTHSREESSETPRPRPDYSTPALRAQAVDRLLREHRARKQSPAE